MSDEILRKHLQAHMEANRVATKTIGELRDEVSRLTAELAAANARAVRAEGEERLAHECNDRLQIYLSQAREQAQANAQFHAAQMAEVTQARDKAREALALFVAYCDMDIEGPASPIEMFDRAEQAAREVMGGEK